MRTRALVLALVAALAASAAVYFVIGQAAIPLAAAAGRSSVEAQAPSTESVMLPGCQIPKSFGRLVTITNGNNSGLAGQAVFEAEDGTIRWVVMMFNSTKVIMQEPSKRPLPANFPIIPIFECMLGNVWTRQ